MFIHIYRAYFQERNLVKQQLDSFDEFIETTIQVRIYNFLKNIEIKICFSYITHTQGIGGRCKRNPNHTKKTIYSWTNCGICTYCISYIYIYIFTNK
jgi:DNA-directed RNA polymerase beta subunit